MHVEHPDMGYRRLRDALAHNEDTYVSDKRVLRICHKQKIQSIVNATTVAQSQLRIQIM